MTKRDYKFKETHSATGEFSPRINAETSALLSMYCKQINENRTKYVNRVLAEDMAKKFNTQEGSKNMDGYESPHTIVRNAYLKGGAELHRFSNGWDDYSAIYVKGVECFSTERYNESRMIKRWNAQSDRQVKRWA